MRVRVSSWARTRSRHVIAALFLVLAVAGSKPARGAEALTSKHHGRTRTAAKSIESQRHDRVSEILGLIERNLALLTALASMVVFFVTTARYITGQKWQRLDFGLKQVDLLHDMESAGSCRHWLEGIDAPPHPVSEAGQPPPIASASALLSFEADLGVSPQDMPAVLYRAPLLASEPEVASAEAKAKEKLSPKEAGLLLLMKQPDPKIHLAFDGFLYGLHKVGIAVDTGCVNVETVRPILRYWLSRLSDGQPVDELRIGLEYYLNTYFKGTTRFIRRVGFEITVWPPRLAELPWWKALETGYKELLPAVIQRALGKIETSGIHVERHWFKDEIILVAHCGFCGDRLELAPLGELQGKQLFDRAIAAATEKRWDERRLSRSRNPRKFTCCERCATTNSPPRKEFFRLALGMVPFVGPALAIAIGSNLDARLRHDDHRRRCLLVATLAVCALGTVTTVLATNSLLRKGWPYVHSAAAKTASVLAEVKGTHNAAK